MSNIVCLCIRAAFSPPAVTPIPRRSESTGKPTKPQGVPQRSKSVARWSSQRSPNLLDEEFCGGLPFSFGCETEILLRPKDGTGDVIPQHMTRVQERAFGQNLMAQISRVLTDAGLPCRIYDESDVSFDNWVVTMDASISKRHQVDGFFPYEIISPILLADNS